MLPEIKEEKTYTVTHIARLTGLTLSNISQLIRRKRIPAGTKIGRTRYLPASVLKLIRKHELNGHWGKIAK